VGFEEELVGAYFSLKREARRYYRDERADDLAAETALRALEARERYDGRPMVAWCRAIMRNLWLNTEKRLSSTHTQRLGCWDGQGGEEADQRAIVGDVLAIVERMRLRSVAVDTLVDFASGYSVEEIAEARGVPAGTVRRRIHDARAMLRALVKVK